MEVEYYNCVIKLINNRGYRWYYCEKNGKMCWVKGNIIITDSVICEAEMPKYICENFDTTKEIVDFVHNCDGQFSVIFVNDGKVLALVDHIRSFPIFIWKKDERVIITDTLCPDDTKKLKICKRDLDFYYNQLFVPFERTLYKEILQVPSGSYFLLKCKEGIEIRRYFVFRYSRNQISSIDEAANYLNNGYKLNFDIVKRIVGDNEVLLPLSGGYDSRLILNGLLETGISKNKIVTYSYGDAEYKDSKISQMISDIMGVKHLFIEYNTNEAREFYKKEATAYYRYASNGTSVPCMQEWYAICKIRKEKYVSDNAYVIPGYGGILAGTYLKENMQSLNCNHREIVKDEMKRIILSNVPRPKEDIINNLSEEILSSSLFYDNDNMIESYERYIFGEEQSKFILNAVRAYEYAGYKWITPFFLKNQFEMWFSIDMSLRIGHKVFLKYVSDYLNNKLTQIEFTGSKVKSCQPSLKMRIIRKIELLTNREHVHYLLTIIPTSIYLKYTLKDLAASPNNIVANETIKSLR